MSTWIVSRLELPVQYWTGDPLMILVGENGLLHDPEALCYQAHECSCYISLILQRVTVEEVYSLQKLQFTEVTVYRIINHRTIKFGKDHYDY